MSAALDRKGPSWSISDNHSPHINGHGGLQLLGVFGGQREHERSDERVRLHIAVAAFDGVALRVQLVVEAGQARSDSFEIVVALLLLFRELEEHLLARAASLLGGCERALERAAESGEDRADGGEIGVASFLKVGFDLVRRRSARRWMAALTRLRMPSTASDSVLQSAARFASTWSLGG